MAVDGTLKASAVVFLGKFKLEVVTIYYTMLTCAVLRDKVKQLLSGWQLRSGRGFASHSEDKLNPKSSSYLWQIPSRSIMQKMCQIDLGVTHVLIHTLTNTLTILNWILTKSSSFS